jgi:LacI family transcriptional regulator
MNPTIRDVAKRANVSVATVSRILNGLDGYSDETKQRVLQTIDEIGYQPNAIARSLYNKRTQTIGVLFPNLTNDFSSAIISGIEDYANDHDYSILVCNGMRTRRYLQLLREKQVDGVIFCSYLLTEEYKQALDAMKVPVILVASISDYASIPYVKVDDKRAAYDATAYLIRKGHREIAMIAGNEDDPIAGIPRVEGYKKALFEHGIPYGEEKIVYGDFSFESGLIAMDALLNGGASFTAIFAASDEMAIGALNRATERGMRIPDDLSIIGYDNLRVSNMVVPSLTTVNQPLCDIGITAAEKLIHMMKNGRLAESTIMEHSIVERQTVKSLC